MKNLFIIICLILLSPPACSQSDNQELALQWLPQGEYSSITFFSQKVLEFSCPGRIYEKIKNNLPPDLVNLPQPFRRNCISMASAVPAILAVVDREEKLADGSVKILNRKCSATFEINGHHFGAFLREDSHLQIFRFKNLELLITSAMSKNIIRPVTNKNIAGQLYLLKLEDGSETFALKADNSYLLVCDDLRNIKKMVSSQDTNSNFLFCNRAAFLINDSYAGQCYLWRITYSKVLYHLIENTIFRSEPQSPLLEAINEETGYQEIFCFDQLYWTDYGERKQIVTTPYLTEEAAASGLKLMFNKPIGGLELIPQNSYYQNNKVTYRDSLRAINKIRSRENNIYNRVLQGDTIIETVLESENIYLESLKAALTALPS